jgi:hypothetical protein
VGGHQALASGTKHSKLLYSIVPKVLTFAKAAVSESQQMGALLLGLDKVLYIIDRCKIYEILYLRDPHPTEALMNFESTLVKLYAVILQFLAKAIRLYDKNTASRAVHAFWNPDDVADFENKCQNLEERVEIDAGNCERLHNKIARAEWSEDAEKLKRLLKELKGLKELIGHIDTGVTALWNRSDKDERTAILLWTSNIPYEDNHKSACDGRTKDTGEWLLTHGQFQEWQSSNESTILWLHGIRKSFLFTSS